jgi:hypothetical protein
MTNQMARDSFNKGWEQKWMIAEDGGIFEGPSGGHSERIGEVKIGDIICADAETFDPDNKIIWRLKSPIPGALTHVGNRSSISLLLCLSFLLAAVHYYT